jgi:hypothetical protein
MPDYDFYRQEYAGSVIPENAFREHLSRGAEWLQWLEGCCSVVSYGPLSRKMALCALAETFYNYRKRRFCQQVQAGSLSVRYERDTVPLQRQLLQSVGGYLEVYRGVG